MSRPNFKATEMYMLSALRCAARGPAAQGSLLCKAYPHFRLRVRSPPVRANLWSLLRCLDSGCISRHGFCDGDVTVTEATLLPRCGSGADPSHSPAQRASPIEVRDGMSRGESACGPRSISRAPSGTGALGPQNLPGTFLSARVLCQKDLRNISNPSGF
jgi:hypothetical protein